MLFQQLDLDGSGTVDFHELHHALRRYDPPPFELSLGGGAGLGRAA